MGIATEVTKHNGRRGEEARPEPGGEAALRGRADRAGARTNVRIRARDERLANALGWFSIGLGLAEVAAPRRVARLISVSDERTNLALLRAMGVRELASGIGILSRQRPARWVWARVVGDGLDLALLGAALRSEESKRPRVAAAMAAVAGVAALDVFCGTRLRRESDAAADGEASDRGILVVKAITVGRPVEEVYRFWRDFQNLPRFMAHLESVQVTGERTSRWRAEGPAGTSVEWEAEIVEDRPNELISWRSLGGSDVDNAGTVRFASAPGGRGTEIHVEMRYAPPAGKIGAAIARLFRREPGQEVQEDLRRFKQVMETGEIVHSDASAARRAHPARPTSAAGRS